MAYSQELADSLVRRQHLVEGFKASEVKRYEKFLRKIDKGLRLQLSKDNLTEFGRQHLNAQLRQTREMLNQIYSEWNDEYAKELASFAKSESDYTVKALGNATPKGFGFNAPSVDQLRAAVNSRPLSVRGPYQGQLLKPFTKEFTETQKRHITGAIRQGFFEGKTNAQILRTIRGTKANNYKDGILNISKNNASAIIRTGVQHTASVARNEVINRNEDIIDGYRWDATLDSRTTQTCRSLDGQVFKRGKGPLPPIHVACRSSIIPELADDLKFLQEGRTRASIEGEVKDESYYDWLNRQSPAFQDTVLGPTRGKLFRDGGLSTQEFARLNIGRDFQPLTLDEMKKLDPVSFNKAFGSEAKQVKAAPVSSTVSKKPKYLPAKDLGEVEKRLRDMGIQNIKLRKVPVEDANLFLEALEEEHSISPLSLTHLTVSNKKSKNFNAAFISYVGDTSYQELEINRAKIGKSFGNKPTSNKEKLKGLKARLAKWEAIEGNRAYNQKDVRRAIRSTKYAIGRTEELIKSGIEPKGWSVSNMSEDAKQAYRNTITHEVGHMRDIGQGWGRAGGVKKWKYNKDAAVTEYGEYNSAEYFAESYVWYRTKGEEGLASDIAQIFREGK